MPIDVKTAFARLKSTPGKGLHYFFVEQGKDGKPILLVDAKKIPEAQKQQALAGAKKKTVSNGELAMDREGELHVTPRGRPPIGLAKGLQIVARNANVMPRAIVVEEALPEDEEETATEQDSGEPEGSEETTPTDTTTGGTTTGGTTAPEDGAPRKFYTPITTMTFPDDDDEEPEMLSAEEDWSEDEWSEEEELVPEDEAPKPKGRLTKEVIQELKQRAAVRHDDPLRADPAMAKLLDARALIAKKLGELGTDAPETTVAPLLEKLAKVEQKLEAAQRRLNAQGIKPRAVAKKYEGEFEKIGWRANVGEAPVRGPNESETDFARRVRAHEDDLAFAESPAVVTKRFTDQEREQARLELDEDGALFDDEGNLLRSERTEMVIDREGTIHRFEANTHTVGPDVEDTYKGRTVPQQQNHHHSSVLQGEEVLLAGGIETDHTGKISEIDNKSGHYMPEAVHMIQAVELLFRNGALLEHEWVDGEGKPLTGDLAKVQKQMTKLQNAALRAALTQGEEAAKPALAQVAVAKKILQKRGCGPSNRPSHAMVSFLEIRKGMQGHQVKDAEATSRLSTTDFLRSGAGNVEQLHAKQGMQAELLEKTAKKREQLDGMAEARARRGPKSEQPGTGGAPSLAEFAESLRELRRKLETSEEIEVDFSDLPDVEDGEVETETPPVPNWGSQTVEPPSGGKPMSVAQVAELLGISEAELWKQSGY